MAINQRNNETTILGHTSGSTMHELFPPAKFGTVMVAGTDGIQAVEGLELLHYGHEQCSPLLTHTVGHGTSQPIAIQQLCVVQTTVLGMATLYDSAYA